MKVRSLGYLRLASPDVAAWRTFAGDFLGMMPVDAGDPEAAAFRIDDFPARLVVEPADEPATTAIGFEVMDRHELAGLVEAVTAAGTAVAIRGLSARPRDAGARRLG